MTREAFTRLTDAQLLAQCAVDTYRASGPGGQKRNKTSSAVRLRHQPSGLMVIAEESRSQHENKAKALRRLRERLHLALREPVTEERLATLAGFQNLGRRAAGFWSAVGLVLDVFSAHEAKVSEAAALLGVSTGQLVDFLGQENGVWGEVNRLRQQFGHRPLVRP